MPFERIQRKRSKGWRMPAGAIYVGRPSMYGNPYDVTVFGVELAMALFENTAYGVWRPNGVPLEKSRVAYQLHNTWLKRLGKVGAAHPIDSIRANLRAANLACWCPLDRPCHADILLKIANAP